MCVELTFWIEFAEVHVSLTTERFKASLLESEDNQDIPPSLLLLGFDDITKDVVPHIKYLLPMSPCVLAESIRGTCVGQNEFLHTKLREAKMSNCKTHHVCKTLFLYIVYSNYMYYWMNVNLHAI